MKKKEIIKFFVVAVKGNTKVYHSPSEYTLLSSLTERLLHFLVLDNTKEIKELCQKELSEIMGNTPLKGNISYYVECAENDANSFEIIRAAHGGGNNQSRRKGGGVVIVTVRIVPVVGEISPIHGTTYYQQENKDGLFDFLGL